MSLNEFINQGFVPEILQNSNVLRKIGKSAENLCWEVDGEKVNLNKAENRFSRQKRD